MLGLKNKKNVFLNWKLNNARESGEIGRRSGFKIHRLKNHEGSIPFFLNFLFKKFIFIFVFVKI